MRTIFAALILAGCCVQAETVTNIFWTTNWVANPNVRFVNGQAYNIPAEPSQETGHRRPRRIEEVHAPRTTAPWQTVRGQLEAEDGSLLIVRSMVKRPLTAEEQRNRQRRMDQRALDNQANGVAIGAYSSLTTEPNFREELGPPIAVTNYIGHPTEGKMFTFQAIPNSTAKTTAGQLPLWDCGFPEMTKIVSSRKVIEERK